MKSSKVFLVVFSAFFLTSNLFSITCNAWGKTGHRIVGEIADRHLSKKAKKAIKQILGPESMAMVSDWPDFIKSDKKYDSTQVWHYINFEDGLTCDQINHRCADDSVNLAFALRKMTAILKDKNSSVALKKDALRFIIHLVGDANQPMHIGRPGDRGGNDVKMTWFKKPTNLHRVWDEDLLESQDLSYTEYATAINHPTNAQKELCRSTDPAEWFCDNYTVTKKLYQYAEKESDLGYRYNYDFLSTLNEQLLKGGLRLANVLNEIYQ
ncbi:S1/P1 nuclease [Solitalea sp. MAHUQ-68]|uniref:S1/P1 nuclease n=1 Tax=Solitalea agri TaxID=2953739 RepID=A0A9X2JCG6_9SPHI|nr:S1/P1 nuclease [Solitalea agri]MCO4293033.1 S1/P1 nuclease [Solitalea agri]